MRRRRQHKRNTGDEEQRHSRDECAPEGEVGYGNQRMGAVADDADGGVSGGGAEDAEDGHADGREMLGWCWAGGRVCW